MLFVVFTHAPAIYPQLLQLNLSWLAWWTGVDVFFVISGFVIARSFFPRIEGHAGQAAIATRFLQRRAMRLLPASLFWASAALLLALVYNQTGIFGPPAGVAVEYLSAILQAKNVAGLILPTYSMGPYWSLALEWQFYLALPLLLIFTPVLLRPVGGLALLAGVLLLTSLFEPTMQFFRVGPIIAGILLYRLSASPWHKRLEPTWLGSHLVRLPAIAGLLFALLLAGTQPGPVHWVGITVVATLLVWIGSYDRGFIALPGMRWVGDRSYSLYLAHMPVMLFLFETGHRVGVTNDGLLFALSFAALLAVSALSYRVLEQPMQRAGRAIEVRGSQASSPPDYTA